MGFNLKTKLFIFHFMVISFALSTASFNSEDEEEWKLATATYTKSTDSSTLTGGACGYGNQTNYHYGKLTAVSGALFGHGEACGGCFEVRCVDHILWCRQGSPSVVVTATDFCAPNYGLAGDSGGWCNNPLEHFDMSIYAFVKIAVRHADIIPVQYKRVKCERYGGMRFTISGYSYFYQVLITNVASDGEITAVKVKGSKTGWIQMARNWGQNWQCNAELRGQPLSFEVRSRGRTVTSYNVVPSNWRYGQTFEGKQLEQ